MKVPMRAGFTHPGTTRACRGSDYTIAAEIEPDRAGSTKPLAARFR